MSPVFGHGGLRLYLLRLLEEQPRHGYELIRLLEDRFLGLYSPSPGTVYPRLAQLERDGLVEHDEQGGRKVYRLTGAGRAELGRRGAELAGLEREVLRSAAASGHVRDNGTGFVTGDADGVVTSELARDVARGVREDVRASVRDLRAELRAAARDVRHEQRRGRRAAGLAPDLEELDAALSAFHVDVLAAARSHRAGPQAVAAVARVLREVRVQLAPLLAGTPAGSDLPGPPPASGNRDGRGPLAGSADPDGTGPLAASTDPDGTGPLAASTDLDGPDPYPTSDGAATTAGPPPSP